VHGLRWFCHFPHLLHIACFRHCMMSKTTLEADMAASNDIESSSTGELPTHYETFPPGTVLLEDPNANTNHGRDGHVVLQPTPSRDRNDPLNVSAPPSVYTTVLRNLSSQFDGSNHLSNCSSLCIEEQIFC
jgi:hypothetical protein